ncbi:MAG TPA: Asp-tRNA(Asn)/Glu-tRNA(Gln) amidotransferase subunit GatB [Candidatus Hydrogenedentes bacterium]|nr:Asp-tRNA(Asn)/Glu-tRNA(Gln) amidotransferase subunit GatB [Candidatus Hydrogenedentota bacterium]
MEYEAVIGMEVHVEIDTRSKVFCACSTRFDAPPNTNVCPVCLGLPGAMPVLNRAMVDASVAVGLALNCTISRWSKLDRKNYFYPDMAKNYQISQYDLPLCHGGWLEIDIAGQTKRIGITRAHMEEDTARNVHGIGSNESGIDFNRSGVPLLEIVTEPDLRSAEEVHAYLVALKQILGYLGVSDCNMEEGSLRAEANVSLRPAGSSVFGTKTEIKNVASFSGVYKAIQYEVARQAGILDEGGAVVQATRGWDADRGVTFEQRSKEEAHDYRYFPEPDLVPVVVDETWEQRIRESLPELPRARYRRFRESYGLSDHDAGILTSTRAMADYFEQTVAAGADAKKAANWIMGDLQALLTEAALDIGQCPLQPAHLADMVALIDSGTISGKIAKEILPEMLRTGKAAKALVKEKGLAQISDEGQLDALARQVVEAHPGPAADFRAGKEKALGFLVGQVMKATRGQANPQMVNEILVKLLTEGK